MDAVGAAVTGHDAEMSGAISTKILEKVAQVKMDSHTWMRSRISVIASCAEAGVECCAMGMLTQGVLQTGSMSPHTTALYDDYNKMIKALMLECKLTWEEAALELDKVEGPSQHAYLVLRDSRRSAGASNFLLGNAERTERKTSCAIYLSRSPQAVTLISSSRPG